MMDHQIKVTLTALNGDLSIAERNLTFNRKDNAIPVGRASKSVTKGILGAANNAWFDSPVMSRNHATIELNPEDMTITIQDIGSMHGTYLNDFELLKDTRTIITDGDVVVFGTEVRRGPEVFPACSFRVNYKSVFHKPANTFSYPESSDVEEDGEENYDDFSEDEIGMGGREQRYSSEDGVSVESATRKASRTFIAVDLTLDDHPRDSISNQVDLTGETEAGQVVEGMSGRPDDIDEHAGQISTAMYVGDNPIVLDSDDEREDEDADFSSDLDDRSEDKPSKGSDRAKMIHAVFEDDSEDAADDSEIEGSAKGSDMDSDAEIDEEELSVPPVTVKNHTHNAVATDENSVIRLSDVRTRLELPSSAIEDDESDFGLSEAGAEGIKALDAASSSLPAPDWVDETATGNPVQAGESSPQVLFTSNEDSGLLAPSASENLADYTPEVHEKDLLRSFSIIRHPSPSDAALVKSAVLPRKVSICDLGESGAYSPQALGAKSGKSAFFAAREVNKAKFDSGKQVNTRSTFEASYRTANAFLAQSKLRKSGETSAVTKSNIASPLSTWDEPAVEQSPFAPASANFDNFDNFDVETTFVGSSNAISSLATRDYCCFLDKPDQSAIAERDPSPLPDMTSSFTYNTSKDSMMSASVPRHNARSAIKITDIVESSPPLITTGSLKRKVDNISNVTDKELRDWASSSVSRESPEDSALALARGEHSSKKSHAEEVPAAKRFKKLLANVGYVTLGGAALFATLVATAPDLM